MAEKFEHRALDLREEMPLVYAAMSKHLFYYRAQISSFVLEKGGVPLNPFMVFDYFLNDAVERDLVRRGNNNMVKKSEQIWTFGAISDGVLAEIQIAKELGKPVLHFALQKPNAIIPISKEELILEPDIADQRHLL